MAVNFQLGWLAGTNVKLTSGHSDKENDTDSRSLVGCMRTGETETERW